MVLVFKIAHTASFVVLPKEMFANVSFKRVNPVC